MVEWFKGGYTQSMLTLGHDWPKFDNLAYFGAFTYGLQNDVTCAEVGQILFFF